MALEIELGRVRAGLLVELDLCFRNFVYSRRVDDFYGAVQALKKSSRDSYSCEQVWGWSWLLNKRTA